MKWKSGVKVEHGDGTYLSMDGMKKRMKEEDQKIVQLMELGIVDDEELFLKVSEQFGEDDIIAGLRLAQFVEDYGEFIAEGEKSKVFASYF